MTPKLCAKGHLKTLRRYGWYCKECESLHRVAREEQKYLEGKRAYRLNDGHTASKSTPTDELCKRGHVRVIRPSGRKTCPTCQNAFSNARRRLIRSRTCEHIDEPGFEGIISETGIMVCLTCLVAEADARAA